MKDTIKIALAAPSFRNGDKEYNTNKALKMIKRAVKQGVDLIAFPETYISGYNLSGSFLSSMAEPIPGPTTELFVKAARIHEIHIILGMPEESGGKIYSSAVLIGPEGLVGSYRKFCVAGPSWGEEWDESRVFDGGDRIEPWKTEIGTIGPVVCFDLFFPEIARVLALKGAELLICLSASWASKERFYAFLKSTAIQNNVFIGYTNLVGIGGYRGERYFGGPRLVNPKGRTISRAPTDVEIMLFGEVDYTQVRERRPESQLLHDLRRFGLAKIYDGL